MNQPPPHPRAGRVVGVSGPGTPLSQRGQHRSRLRGLVVLGGGLVLLAAVPTWVVVHRTGIVAAVRGRSSAPSTPNEVSE